MSRGKFMLASMCCEGSWFAAGIERSLAVPGFIGRHLYRKCALIDGSRYLSTESEKEVKDASLRE